MNNGERLYQQERNACIAGAGERTLTNGDL
jgi:hypothetical protein